MSERPVKRSYNSPARRASALATRERICKAAEELFVGDGYARTSIRAVAANAGVSEATVYNTFPNKAALLDATIMRAIRDPGESVADILTSPPEQILPRLAESHAAVLRRAARIIAIGESSALMDAELRPFRERAHERIRAGLRAVADRLEEASLLRPGLTAEGAATILYAISNDTTYLRATEGGGQQPETYASWLTALLESALLG